MSGGAPSEVVAITTLQRDQEAVQDSRPGVTSSKEASVPKEAENCGDWGQKEEKWSDDQVRSATKSAREQQHRVPPPPVQVSRRNSVDADLAPSQNSQISTTPQFSLADAQKRALNGDTVKTTTKITAQNNKSLVCAASDDATKLSESIEDSQNLTRGIPQASLPGSSSQARLAESSTSFTSSHSQSKSSEPDTTFVPSHDKSASTVTSLVKEHDKLLSVNSALPRDRMGHANTRQTPRWITSTKMDSPTTPVRDNKDREDDGYSVDDSVNSSNVSSPAMHPLHENAQHGNFPPLILPSLGTPSTVSTAPSTDDVSLEGALSPTWEKLSLRLDDAPGSSREQQPRSIVRRQTADHAASGASHDSRGQQLQYHRRSASWGTDAGRIGAQPFAHHMVHPSPDSHGGSHANHGWGQSHAMQSHGYGMPYGAHGNAWDANARSEQARTASFRRADSDTTGRSDHLKRPYPQAVRQETWHHRAAHFDPRNPNQPVPVHQMNVDGRTGQAYRHPGLYHGQPKMAYAGRGSPSHTPPRSQNPRQPGHSPSRLPPSSPGGSGGSPGQSGFGSPRSQAEVLKTLLRKKACLYEPETSRAVALMTWLVGRELALAYGYFSRQQLQAGVHSCVAQKIESGTITRTKVNRCMQIILNSCFHYIIPRPDGSEEKGDPFRQAFALSVKDDSDLLQALPAPWNDLVADRDTILNATFDGGDGAGKHKTTSPTSSPRQSGVAAEGDGETKRAVLLCFNENVRSAEDVFRCHNEFIRDTANASNLHLSAKEWRTFFGKDATTSVWGHNGISIAPSSMEHPAVRTLDFFGEMSVTELSKFRTSWCAKRYDHDHEMCGFAHVEVNGGWLRRDPSKFTYNYELCPSIKRVVDKNLEPGYFVINQCERGAACLMAHSKEEILYHPQMYKRQPCPSQSGRAISCKLADVCPHLHPSESTHYQVRRRGSGDGRASQRQGFGRQGSSSKLGITPEGSPMLYVDPAPPSAFEEHLGMPGLQSLFRRNCEVTGGLLSNDQAESYYTPFGSVTNSTNDDATTTNDTDDTTKPSRGLPNVRKEG